MPRRRQARLKVALGGAARRQHPSRAAQWLVDAGLVPRDCGAVVDFGCGFGRDGDTFGWQSYDPHYRDGALPDNFYSHAVCVNVLSALCRERRAEVLQHLQRVLRREGGVAYLCVPRSLPPQGKLSGYARRPQYNVVLDGLRLVRAAHDFAIYALRPGDAWRDRTLG